MLKYDSNANLNFGHSRSEHKTLIIPVNHREHTNRSCCKAPRVLIRILLRLRLRILEYNLKHLAKVLAQMMTRRCLQNETNCLRHATQLEISNLNSSSTTGYVCLDGGRKITASELLLLGLSTLDHRNGQKFFVDACVQIQYCIHLQYTHACATWWYAVQALHVPPSQHRPCSRTRYDPLARGTRECARMELDS